MKEKVIEIETKETTLTEMEKLTQVMRTLQGKRTELRPIPLKALRPWESHFRDDGGQVEVLAQKMREEGYRAELPVVVDTSTMEVVVGVLRLFAAQKAGNIPEIPCVCYERLDPIERIVLACDDGLKRTKKSQRMILRQIEILHNEHGFSCREIAYLLGMSKSAVARKVQLLTMDKSIQSLYEENLIGDADIDRIAKEIPVQHQGELAKKIAELGKKISRTQLEKLFMGYRKSLSSSAGQEAAPAIPFPDVSDSEVENEMLKRMFPKEMERLDKNLRQPSFRWEDDLRVELDQLMNHMEVVREAIRIICGQLGIESVVISRQEEEEILIERDMVRRKESSVPKPTPKPAWTSDELRKPETVSEIIPFPQRPEMPPCKSEICDSEKTAFKLDFPFGETETDEMLDDDLFGDFVHASDQDGLDGHEFEDIWEADEEMEPVPSVELPPREFEKVFGRMMKKKGQ